MYLAGYFPGHSLEFWTLLCGESDQRYFSGLLSAVASGFFTFVFLEPMFVPVGLELAMVALWILSICAGMVGMSLGVLLPTLLPGICFGFSLSLLVGSFMGVTQSYFLPLGGGICALVGILLCTRYVAPASFAEPANKGNPSLTLFVTQRKRQVCLDRGHHP